MNPLGKKMQIPTDTAEHRCGGLIAISWSSWKETTTADRLVSNATNVPSARTRARSGAARVGAEKNHVCIYISTGINHSTEKSRHKTQTGSQRGTAHPLNTQWPYVPDVHIPAPTPYRKMLLLFTGELQTLRNTRFPGVYIVVEFMRFIVFPTVTTVSIVLFFHFFSPLSSASSFERIVILQSCHLTFLYQI